MPDLSEEEIFENDVDPIDGINEIRRAEAKENKTEEDFKEIDTNSEGEVSTLKENDSGKDSSDKANFKDPSDDLEELTDEEEVDDKAESKELIEAVKRTFKANGQEFSFTEAEMLEQFEGTFGKAMDYTQKMQKMAPYRKMISALEEESISQDQFNMAMDILKGDKGAIRQLAADRDIDLGDLSFEEDEKPYAPNSYGKSDFDLQIAEIETQIGKDPEYKTTVDVIDNQWDDNSRRTIAENPDMIMGLHTDIKSGVYAQVAPEAAKMAMLDGNSRSNLDYYILAGNQMRDSMRANENKGKLDDLNKDAQDAEEKFGKESSTADKKRAATNTASRSGKKGVVDYLDDDDDENFNAWYKNLLSKN